MPNVRSLAGLEVAEKFVWGGGVGWGGAVCKVIFMSNPTTAEVEVEVVAIHT